MFRAPNLHLSPAKLSHNSISSHHVPLRSWLQDPHIRALDRISRPALRGSPHGATLLVRTVQPCAKPAQNDAATQEGRQENTKSI